MELVKSQQCPHCGNTVDDSHAEWEDGQHTVECEHCKKGYLVITHYKFLGFEIEKCCSECNEVISECYCGE
ncbi:hypothetical protein [Brevibacillus laterosporus]|uniref:Uncharacterized protein n=1 Tax=Brevibacillus laterosporus TaxID=1465 RepID=A0AAP3DK71_BRELA|nr:hypothetical protein [Brevibacillus laterosporus]MCR8982640.1 hypothetical protein [Brevibacillus laterosporus]MCZ0809796.1 hypothetical protein [Brevibacillus laterosporus]MCZ0828370.1 hypothetical protein [Brevibacillus laterosporus]MCZ0852380.1 hypothetical protein [Brevibacillus laterosporus]